mmetsp:Transcript_17289/g.26745  ORF Transcript_17289/g.26745 Transcript_17289/m.26745 type:complete len:85 (-) Transcript_17289:118-372(-)|eukprot:CAMPEP_0184290732 /NCGR_PEP_ID=MMETSP1049-20130417/2904_1 /TAXON_ID=77928 /ORGANISM="Proteomonas sulcata, Strain CCMP704" /LENGTH=84 /DNA_ID=CAMNT_0026597951 /DNA_START=193 /DNA_END=447 /DNA_ORIENTATION=-
MVASGLLYHAGSLLPGLNMLPQPKKITVPDLVCSNLGRQANVAKLIYADSHGSAKVGGAEEMMKAMQSARLKAARLGCAVPKGM